MNRRLLALRLALLGLGLATGLGLAELALRLYYPRLPSLAALDRADPREVGEFMRWSDPAARAAGCRPMDDTFRLHYRPRYADYPAPDGAPEAEPLQLLVAGDSLVAGWGVGPGTAWPHGLARRAAAQRQESVRLTLAGGGGLGYCEVLLDLNRLLDHLRPDAVVVQLFADDLEQRAHLLLKEGLVSRPDLLPGPFAWAARRSWLANRLWFAWVRGHGGAAPLRATDEAGRALFLKALTLIADRLEPTGAALLFVLVPPAGAGRCQGQAAWSDCDWLLHDQDWMAEALAAGGLPWLDLRAIWRQRDPETLPEEEQAWDSRGRLPVHPGERGHEALAEAIWPALDAALRGAGASP